MVNLLEKWFLTLLKPVRQSVTRSFVLGGGAVAYCTVFQFFHHRKIYIWFLRILRPLLTWGHRTHTRSSSVSSFNVLKWEADDLHRHSVITWRVNTPKDKAVSRAVDVKAFYSSSSLTQMLGESEPSVTELFVHSHHSPDPSTVKSRVNKGQCEHGEYTQVQVFLCHLFSVFLLQSEKI